MLWPAGSCWVLLGPGGFGNSGRGMPQCLRPEAGPALLASVYATILMPKDAKHDATVANPILPLLARDVSYNPMECGVGPYALQNVVHPCGVRCTVHCTAGNGWCFLSLSVSISWCQVLEAMTEAGPQISPLPSLATCCCNLPVTCCNMLIMLYRAVDRRIIYWLSICFDDIYDWAACSTRLDFLTFHLFQSQRLTAWYHMRMALGSFVFLLCICRYVDFTWSNCTSNLDTVYMCKSPGLLCFPELNLLLISVSILPASSGRLAATTGHSPRL